MVELERNAPSPDCVSRAVWENLGPFPGHRSFGLQMSAMHLSVLVDGCGAPLAISAPADSFMGWTHEDNNLKESVCGIFTSLVGIQNSQSPQWHPPLLSNRLKELGESSIWHNLVWFCISAYELDLVWSGGEPCAAQRAGSIDSSEPSEESASHRPASPSIAPRCVCMHSSWPTQWLLPGEREHWYLNSLS